MEFARKYQMVRHMKRKHKNVVKRVEDDKFEFVSCQNESTTEFQQEEMVYDDYGGKYVDFKSFMNLFFSVLKWKDLKNGQNKNFYNCILFVMKRPKIDRLINIPKRITFYNQTW